MEGNIFKKAEEEAQKLIDLLEADQKKPDPSVKPEWAAKIIAREQKKPERLKQASNDDDAQEGDKQESA